MAWANQWRRHPGVRKHEELSLGERAADHMRNTMGSWTFVFCFFIFMILWALLNSVFHLGGGKGYDPYPYILLNLFLSMLAGVQAAALLIAAKRQDQISSEIAVHTEKNTDDIKSLLEQNTDLTEAIEKLTKEIHAKFLGSPEGFVADDTRHAN